MTPPRCHEHPGRTISECHPAHYPQAYPDIPLAEA